MTKNRQEILNIIKVNSSPLNASQIHSYSDNCSDLATVYRGLHYLENNDYVRSFVFDCHERGMERYYSLKKSVHEHFMHCEYCHRFFILDNCPFKNSFRQIEKNTGFRVEEHYITLKGICSECSRTIPSL